MISQIPSSFRFSNTTKGDLTGVCNDLMPHAVFVTHAALTLLLSYCIDFHEALRTIKLCSFFKVLSKLTWS